jgi:hypothetical protein
MSLPGAHVVLTPLQLVEKLAALIPPPRVNMIRYHGAFAPNAAVRSQIVATATPAATSCRDNDRCTHPGRQRYALLMKRIFSIDVERCCQCGERATVIEFVTAPDDIERILRSVGYPNAPDDDNRSAA